MSLTALPAICCRPNPYATRTMTAAPTTAPTDDSAGGTGCNGAGGGCMDGQQPPSPGADGTAAPSDGSNSSSPTSSSTDDSAASGSNARKALEVDYLPMA